ncbi:Monooxygenase, FAD-binding protein [Metarhizium guizhouense ARSEF 977]|uniref:Monooxygenase, FAD-binding protein n=1 Tax=Metarhizium guizhouense (strain ARSEF 977) TaxID=1276136 RepID=A0A0B4H2U3_METGA|nr:Monooxygenase, FAD-binding protein [Metarhizium guizhouense ARSEF 977]
MPLDIAIIGAGIAGLTAAVSLRRSGHRVQIYEASAFSGEIGAALNLTPNGVQVLQHLGFDFERAKAVQMVNWDTVSGIDLARIACQDLHAAADKFGAPFFAVHRVDLHRELMRLANVSEARGPGTDQQADGILLQLASPVTRVDAQEGRIEFADGTVRHADLVVGADGLRSVVRDAVARGAGLAEPIGLVATGQSAFRFLVPTEDLQATASGRKLLAWKTPGACLLADTKLVDKERHIMWYPCRDGAVQNFVGIHPSLDTAESDAPPDVQAQMLRQFGHFDADVVQILRDAKDTKCWPLFSMKPLSSWTFGKAVLIGDAAHPMLPFGGQGSNQAIEDGGVLGRVLAGVQDATGLPQRLELFDKLRVRRASRIQILSSVRANNEHLVQDQIAQYMEPGVPRMYSPWLSRAEADADIMMTFSTQLIPWPAGS